MTQLNERLRDILQDAVPEPPNPVLDPAQIRRARRQPTASTLRGGLLVLSAASLVVIVAAGIVLVRRGGDSRQTGAGDGPHSLSAQILLSKTNSSANGQPIPGQVVLTNNTGKPIEVADGACTAWKAVFLSNDNTPPQRTGFAGEACARATIPTGISRQPIRVDTVYSDCLQPGGSSSDTPRPPACVGPGHNEMPPLPPGRYIASIMFRGLSTQPDLAPAPTVVLTRP